MTPTAKQIEAKGNAQEPKNHDHVAEKVRKAYKRGARWAARFKARRSR